MEKLMITVKGNIDARDKGIPHLTKEYHTFKKELIPLVQEAVRKVVKDPEIMVYSQQKWALDKKLTEYIKNLPCHPMPFHNESVWIEQTEKGYFRIHFKNKQLPKGQDITCNLIVPKKRRDLLQKASEEKQEWACDSRRKIMSNGRRQRCDYVHSLVEEHPKKPAKPCPICGGERWVKRLVLGQVQIIEDNQYARFNVHITLRLPRPKPYEPTGWVGVDVGWNNLAVSVFVTNKHEIKDATFHSRNFKTQIIRLKYLLKQYQRSGRSWKKWNYRKKNTTNNAVGNTAKEIVEKAKKHHGGVAFEDLTFPSQTKRFLIPRYKLKCAIQNLCERQGIPFTLVNPRDTSITCNKCGHKTKESRNGKTFKCVKCGYEANADFNACVNIAKRAILH